MEYIKKKRSNDETNKKSEVRVRINVGGTLFETFQSTLERIPGTRLALLPVLGEADDTWDSERGEFFFDRHPGVFSMIMQYYRSEELHTDHNVCGNIIQGELDFWGLTELDIEPCCWGHYSKFKDHRETLAALDDNFTQQNEMEAWTENTTNFQKFKHRIWQFLEEPSTSRGAKVYAVLSMFFVVLSIAIFCLETYHWFRVPIPGANAHNASKYDTYFSPTGDQCIRTKHESGQYLFEETEPHPAMTYLDYVCAAYFTIEYIARFFFAPSKLKFIKGPLNVIDLLCLVPHLIAIIMVTVDPYGSSKDTSNLFRAFLALRTVRILRIFKLMKHYSAFKILVYTIKVSTKELLLMVIFLFTGVLIFASIIFYTENDTFDSIPVGFWWALVTMTTVGYGDKVPKTEGGYIIGCGCVLCGVLTVAFTVPIVVNNFTLYYSHAQSRIKLPVHKRKELKRKIFLKNQKSIDILKFKWKKDKTKRATFNDMDTIHTPRDPPSGQEDTEEVSTPPNSSRVTLVLSDNTVVRPGTGKAVYENAINHSSISETDSDIVPVETPDRIHTVSESIDFSIAETASLSLPGTPSDISNSNEHHLAETEQLLMEFADYDKKRKEERKRQLELINHKRDLRRQQQLSHEPRKRPHVAAGSSKPSNIRN
ncbi:potassium voltage-gated channel protein Shaw-like [Ruditapes philippinarum]|uniref:potassium voltage-gated channel protein Shaw-like n=1 Tax=Ruditapes philippinarum TaxID=129788 RepID=UPI00295B8A83|nr:potassium voltage-gated channel protein Shaw-like [Ruditapes philippinarum]